MADRAARDAAIEALEGFRDGRLTNRQFEAAWPTSDDRALDAIEAAIWMHYDDFHEHPLEAPAHELIAGLNRCVAFLRTDLPYEWPHDERTFLRRMIDLFRPVKTPFSSGDAEAWPFLRNEDLRRISD